jgi:hypothetical protein
VLRQLATFRFLYIAAKDAYFEMAEERFRSLVRYTGEIPLDKVQEAFSRMNWKIRKLLENGRAVPAVA